MINPTPFWHPATKSWVEITDNQTPTTATIKPFNGSDQEKRNVELLEVENVKEVTATPKENDFSHEFQGTIQETRPTGKHGVNHILVKDQDDNVFCCDPDQLTPSDQ